MTESCLGQAEEAKEMEVMYLCIRAVSSLAEVPFCLLNKSRCFRLRQTAETTCFAEEAEVTCYPDMLSVSDRNESKLS